MSYYKKNKMTYPAHIALALALVGSILSTGCSQNAPAAENVSAQTTFATPAEAGEALQTASRAHDESSLGKVLGEGSAAILSSGDPAEDKAAIDAFTKKYDRMNRWVTLTDGSEILYVGADNYPFPIPLAKDSSDKWYFDTAAGEDEILARRIGRNELLAIGASRAMAKAQEVYFKTSSEGHPGRQYAQRIVSSTGAKDGLYWNSAKGDALSPLSRLSGFPENVTAGEPQIFDGYSFRILTAQGSAAKGGSRSYVADGRMTGGFAVMASPAKYADSGIMTFILNRDGVVYQKDLGKKTAEVAASIKEYNPTDGWTRVE
jgi:hypothetical protein